MVVRVALAGPGPTVDEAERLDYEKEDHFDFQWWTVADIVARDQRFYPGRLPALLASFLDGQQIDEPFELWS